MTQEPARHQITMLLERLRHGDDEAREAVNHGFLCGNNRQVIVGPRHGRRADAAAYLMIRT